MRSSSPRGLFPGPVTPLLPHCPSSSSFSSPFPPPSSPWAGWVLAQAQAPLLLALRDFAKCPYIWGTRGGHWPWAFCLLWWVPVGHGPRSLTLSRSGHWGAVGTRLALSGLGPSCPRSPVLQVTSGLTSSSCAPRGAEGWAEGPGSPRRPWSLPTQEIPEPRGRPDECSAPEPLEPERAGGGGARRQGEWRRRA